MPAYDFRCTACDETFEIVRPLGEAADVSCPACGAPAKKVFSPVGVVFKGSGFHNTDYRTPKKSEPSSTEKGSCPSSGSSGSCASCPAGE